ncbi:MULTISPECIES: rhodanese-like domain-containing protein [Streptomyces]|uniref:Rhodanese-like domain-containing protein n=1 Tax=Streptomyces gilvifuscus TaxID=1550617 RepID=A0ABT5G6I6_9ACTN|nr:MULTISPECIES: rhodanese-like domain-containing protein [Streptomyces]MBK3645416.1 rhodanese-like domain-containing protein [Streptomyces sp. MBT33]MDC2960197.1 rhodanese-like domain-containing protein [Streptomyces gilvifuscus]
MSIFRRQRGGPGRVSVQVAAERTGHGDGGADAVLLDVREPYEWQAGHAPGAVHLSLSALAAGAGLPARAQARPLVVICRSGNRSRQAAELLVARGAQAVDVVGGMRDWAAAGLPVVDARGGNGTIA